MVVACLALFVASTGTGIAARHYLITSTKQIKPSVITKLKGNIGPRGYQGEKGAAGANGATGATGATGAAGKNGATSVITRTVLGAASTGFSLATATCAAGEVATGGGVTYNIISGSVDVSVVASYPQTNASGVPNAWFASIENYDAGSAQANVYVICASP
jgi:hypothetical protein